ncbi:MAG: histidine kinase N-terminal 7TM domain-containing protein [Lachnospiraceae bacterium]|nr:histidine kinase N-terminal 7TM domain-containing protein [Lachnospiraceae bacterium]
MKEVTRVLKRLGMYYLLMALAFIPCSELLPSVFPIRNITTIYYLILGVGLIFYYSYRVSRTGGLRRMMKAIAWLEFLLILFRALKYVSLREVDVLARHAWYLYYLPILLIPLFLFFIALLVSETDRQHIRFKWLWTIVFTGVLVVLVLTNDVHQWIFRFQPGFENWDGTYTYGLLYYVVTVWEFILYTAAVAMMVRACRVRSARRHAWLISLPFAIGVVLLVLLITDTMPRICGVRIMEFPETILFMVAGVMECAMVLGLIPTNDSYGKLFQISSVAAQIVDKNGDPVYRSPKAATLSPEQMSAEGNTRIGEHTVLHRMELPGGFGFWQDDVTALDHLNEQLKEAKERLSEETELLRLQNELQKQQKTIEARTRVYDTIARRTKEQSQKISGLADEALQTEDPGRLDELRKEIVLRGAYIKRYSNLMLLSSGETFIDVGEVALSLSEILRYLNLFGISVELLEDAAGRVQAEAALSLFEVLERLVEDNRVHLRGVAVRFRNTKKGIACRFVMENLQTSLEEDARQRLLKKGIETESFCEEGITYLTFYLQDGGEL